jgi:hypothetical protein
MRNIMMVAALAAVTLFGTQPGSSGVLYEGPWCANITLGEDAVTERCDMRSFAMCLEEIKGGHGTCSPNPRYRGEEPRRKGQRVR